MQIEWLQHNNTLRPDFISHMMMTSKEVGTSHDYTGAGPTDFALSRRSTHSFGWKCSVCSQIVFGGELTCIMSLELKL